MPGVCQDLLLGQLLFFLVVLDTVFSFVLRKKQAGFPLWVWNWAGRVGLPHHGLKRRDLLSCSKVLQFQREGPRSQALLSFNSSESPQKQGHVISRKWLVQFLSPWDLGRTQVQHRRECC